VDVIATDEAGNITTQEISLTVTDIDDTPPVITSEEQVSFEENGTGVVYVAAANEMVTFSLGTANDELLFTLTGEDLQFAISPDFEDPKDANGDNTYVIVLQAVDVAGNRSSKTVEIQVTNIENETVLNIPRRIASWEVYPNPVENGPVQLNFQEDLSGLLLLHNSAGQLIKKYTVSGNRMELDLSDLSTGLYLIRYLDRDGSDHQIRLLKK